MKELEVDWKNHCGVDVLIGKTLQSVETDGAYLIHFTTTDGDVYQMFHAQDCCEHVYIESIVGDLQDLVGSPILMAEESSNHSMSDYDSETWTFYKFATIKGYVDIRWNGSSNGYYSESVDFGLTVK